MKIKILFFLALPFLAYASEHGGTNYDIVERTLNFLLFFGGVNALHSIRLIYQKSVTGYIIWFVAWALILYASYWNNQHEKPYKTENAMLDFLVCIVNGNPFPDKIEDPNKLRAIIALVLTILMIIA